MFQRRMRLEVIKACPLATRKERKAAGTAGIRHKLAGVIVGGMSWSQNTDCDQFWEVGIYQGSFHASGLNPQAGSLPFLLSAQGTTYQSDPLGIADEGVPQASVQETLAAARAADQALAQMDAEYDALVANEQLQAEQERQEAVVDDAEEESSGWGR